MSRAGPGAETHAFQLQCLEADSNYFIRNSMVKLMIMAAVWKHQKLGKLKYDGGRDAWVGIINVPAFKAFTHSWDDHVHGRCDLVLQAEDDTDTPSSAAVELALKTLANQEKLVKSITASLWKQFKGSGPKSGMWWYGGLDQVIESGEDENVPALKNASSLLAWMHPNGIIVRHSGIRSEVSPVVEITFSAVFEMEHGVGILTDGVKVLGTGYTYDVEPFEEE